MHHSPLAKRPPIRPATVACALLLALGGCATVDRNARDYAQSSTEIGEGLSPAQSDPRSPGWWGVLNDPLLVGLLERSSRDDLDLSEALARVRESRALRGSTAADRFPTISTGAAAARTQDNEETTSGPVNELYSPRFDASWELGVFGGPRSVTGATEAELGAGVEDVRDALVTLFAEVALNYVEACSFQTRLSLAEENIRSQSEIFVITRWRRQARLTTKRDLERARLNLEETRAEIPLLETGLAQARHRLAVLLDEPPDALLPELTVAKAIPNARFGLAVGMPADVLRRRPDVRRAERELAVQLAPAAAEPKPGFSLLGSIGLEALAPGRWLSSAAMSSLVDRSVNWTLFDAESIRESIDVQTALQEQALIDYEAAVIAALQEVEDVLVAYAKEQARRESLERATQSALSAAELANKRYISGQIGFEAVLEAQRSLLSLQDQLAASEGESASHFIRLYKALAGGWAPMDPVAPRTAAREPESGLAPQHGTRDMSDDRTRGAALATGMKE